MFKRFLSLGAAALAGLTAACEDGPATMAGTWRSPAAWSTMVYAVAKGPMLVEVHGQPFPVDRREFTSQVADALSGQVIGRVVRFTDDRDQAPEPAIRLVLAFNPSPKQDAESLCGGQSVATAAEPGGKVTVLAAFCHDGKLLASARGWVAKVDGPSDKRFRQMLGQLARELFQEAR